MAESTVLYLDAHSRAKVKLIKAYLGAYLNILERVSYINEVHVLDLLCGEGQYLNDNPNENPNGTALEIIDAVKQFCEANLAARNTIVVWLNDSQPSNIEENVFKIDRVQRLCTPVLQTLPDNIRVRFDRQDAHVMVEKALQGIRPGGTRHALFILDPYGYKGFSPELWKQILNQGGTEIIQFLPASFMQRFATTAVESIEPQYQPLKKHLQEVFGDIPPGPCDIRAFLRRYIDCLQDVLGEQHYLANFNLDTGTGDVYTLLFMTRNLRGLEVMVDAIWKLDPAHGDGHRPDINVDQFALFPVSSELLPDLIDYIRSSPSGRSNLDVTRFTLRRGFRTKHANDILKPLRKSKDIIVTDPAGLNKSAFYLGSDSIKNKLVTIRWVTDA